MEDIKKYIGMRIEHYANVVDVGFYYGIPVALIKYDKRNFLDKNNYSIATDFYIDESHKLHYKKHQFFTSERKAKNEFSKLINNSKELTVKLLGFDDWERPVYKDKNGNLYKGVNQNKDVISLCTVGDNEFYGEPHIPIKDDVKINIVKTFNKDRER